MRNEHGIFPGNFIDDSGSSASMVSRSKRPLGPRSLPIQDIKPSVYTLPFVSFAILLMKVLPNPTKLYSITSVNALKRIYLSFSKQIRKKYDSEVPLLEKH